MQKHQPKEEMARVVFYVTAKKKKLLMAISDKVGQSLTTYINRLIDKDLESRKRKSIPEPPNWEVQSTHQIDQMLDQLAF